MGLDGLKDGLLGETLTEGGDPGSGSLPERCAGPTAKEGARRAAHLRAERSLGDPNQRSSLLNTTDHDSRIAATNTSKDHKDHMWSYEQI